MKYLNRNKTNMPLTVAEDNLMHDYEKERDTFLLEKIMTAEYSKTKTLGVTNVLLDLDELDFIMGNPKEIYKKRLEKKKKLKKKTSVNYPSLDLVQNSMIVFYSLICQSIAGANIILRRALIRSFNIFSVLKWIVIFIAIMQWLKGTNGEQTCKTIACTENSVLSCPPNEAEWYDAKRRKNCSGVNEIFEYHCVPDSRFRNLVEVCAPVKQIIGGNCTVYDMGAHQITWTYNASCRNHSAPTNTRSSNDTTDCPVVYKSNESYKFPVCFSFVLKKDQGNGTSSDPSHPANIELCVIVYAIFPALFIGLVLKYICSGKEKISESKQKEKGNTVIDTLLCDTTE